MQIWIDLIIFPRMLTFNELLNFITIHCQNPTAKLKESSLPGTIITKVEAIDADHGDYGKVHYSISPRNKGSISKIITVNKLDGRVTLRRQISWNKFPM